MEPTPLGTAAGAHWESGGASCLDLPGATGKSRLAAAATVPTRAPNEADADPNQCQGIQE